MAKPNVLIIEDSPSLALGYAAQLEEAGYLVKLATTLAEAREALSGGTFAAALLDLQLPDGDGLTLLQARIADAPAFIVITSDGSLSRAIAAMRLGAFDFLVKPVSGTRLLSTIRSAVDQAQVKENKTPKGLPKDDDRFHGFIGRSPAMKQVYRTIQQVADSRAAVFVTGETGTGKEVTAEALHAASRRSRRAFVAINCGAIPENLLESELFGHVKGAFTGAVENRIGAAKAADGGTLFLDEICEMELKLQVKLLRFLQTDMIQQVGSSRAEPVDVRIVCASNRDPFREISEGRFREDLFYRLNVIPLHLPALRERGDDILLLAGRLAASIAQEEGRGEMELSKASRAEILAHAWPGNVRELQNTLRRAIVTAPDTDIEVNIPHGAASRMAGGASTAFPPLQVAARPADPHGPFPVDLSGLNGLTLAEIERIVIEAAIERQYGNIAQAAKRLAVNPSTIYRKLEKWNE
ncbi:response regulator [Altererythrobacter confluentis]|uniref:Response regulator n=1 Tax=Allopontixanthobacter confluentis TaxID=1849021 RepID=A0A6L7GFB7_9SPHN|nr:sigma-54 dependent transcriptional regulator [Allopontixanthobacter confluentis]MXP14175.1 response regulator [Allopontixanthobacter confluentis]